MRENYSEYRLKIYADKGKLNPRSEGLFTVIERGKSTVCYELKQSNSKERMTLKDIDQITMAFQNQQQLIHHFFHTSNISNIPTVRIYKKRKNYQTDGRKEESFLQCTCKDSGFVPVCAGHLSRRVLRNPSAGSCLQGRSHRQGKDSL